MQAKITYPLSPSFLDYPENDHCVTVYFIGCWGRCKGCHNWKLIDVDYDESIRIVSLNEFNKALKESCKRNLTKNVCLMGGDPLYDTNIEFVKEFLKINDFFNICLYTGQEAEFVKKNKVVGWKYLKTGMYDESKFIGAEKTNNYFQLATSNQKIYDSKFNLLSEKGKWNYGD